VVRPLARFVRASAVFAVIWLSPRPALPEPAPDATSAPVPFPAPVTPFRLRDDPRVLEMKRDAIWSETRLERHERAERARELRTHDLRPRRRSRRPPTAGRRIRPEHPDEDERAGRIFRGRAFATSIRAAQSAPGNVLVNDRSLDGFGAAQSEESIAMTGSLGLAAWNNGQGFYNGSDSQGAAWTANGGASWTKVAIPHPPGAQAWYWFSDPLVTVTRSPATSTTAA
jgi:hypothetical protein